MSPTEGKRVAIVGGGCTGVASYWALQHYSNNDVHLFEASSMLGGRVRTVPFEYDETHANISTEISCFNAEASPNFNSLLRNIGLSTSRRPFIFGATAGAEVYEWRRNLLWSVLFRPWSFCSLEKCRVLFDIVRLKYLVLGVLMERSTISDTCSTNAYEYLSNEGFSTSFQDKYLAPLLSALWGTNAGRFLSRISMIDLARFLYDQKLHKVLKTAIRWRHIDATASQFIQCMTAGFPPDKVHMMTKVQEVRRIGKKGYRLLMSTGEEMSFDRVIFAVDSQEALRLLKPTIGVEETEVLRGIRTIKNIAVLHSDFLLMPNAQISPCYNYILSSETNKNSPNNDSPNTNSRQHPPSASLTYNVNALQNISSSISGPIAITVNPFTPPHPRHVQAVWEFTDTEISSKTLDIQHRRLPSIQNKDGLSYCSVWTGRGFFEDAVTAAFQVVVDHYRVEMPFEVTTQHQHFRNHNDMRDTITLGVRDHLVLTSLELLRVYVRVFELFLTLLDLVRVLLLAVWKPTQKSQKIQH